VGELLVLFDIDGTLFLTPDDLYNQALVVAAREVYGYELTSESFAGVDHPGETATRGLRKLLLANGLEEHAIEKGLARWCKRHAQLYVELLAHSDTSFWEAAPEAAETLARLARQHRLALLTGNAAQIARARLERLGLSDFFPSGQGAFGCEADERPQLIQLALRRAGDWPSERTVLVGDTPRDIDGARQTGVRAVGVTSGHFGAEDLAAATAVIGSLRELPAALDRL
jgi:phosphoglycolate phosphatase